MSKLSSILSSELLAQTKKLVGEERNTLAQFLAHLAEVDFRKIHVDEGFSSLFSFLTRGLNMSEGGAVKRVRAARLGRQHPQVLAMIGTGEIHLTGASILYEHRDQTSFHALLSSCIRKTSKEIEVLLAKTFAIQGPVRESIRLIAAPKMLNAQENSPIIDAGVFNPGNTQTLFSESVPQTSKNEGAESNKFDENLAARIAITISKVDLDRLNRLKQLSPGDNLAKIFGDALAALLAQRDPAILLKNPVKTLAKKSPSVTTQSIAKNSKGDNGATRYIPKNVRREVYLRDNGCCTFTSANGQQCTARGRLEFDHIVPFALNGANDANNLRLRCKAHNLHHARAIFGSDFMQAEMGHLRC